MSQKILSFDCANKSLAHSLVEIKINDIIKLYQHKLKQEIVIELDDIIKYITYKDGGVIDLLNGKKLKDVTAIERAKSLKNYIGGKNFDIDKDTLILIEKQPERLNVKSCSVGDQLIFNYADMNIKTINPTLKNKISFSSPDDKLIYNKFIEKYSSSYTANKNHSKENFLYFLKKSGQENILKNIKKSNYDDIADSFMQILAYVLFIH